MQEEEIVYTIRLHGATCKGVSSLCRAENVSSEVVDATYNLKRLWNSPGNVLVTRVLLSASQMVRNGKEPESP